MSRKIRNLLVRIQHLRHVKGAERPEGAEDEWGYDAAKREKVVDDEGEFYGKQETAESGAEGGEWGYTKGEGVEGLDEGVVRRDTPLERGISLVLFSGEIILVLLLILYFVGYFPIF